MRRALLAALLLAPAVAAAQATHDDAPRVDLGHHEGLYGAILVDKLEMRPAGDGTKVGAWEGQGWYGSDYDKLWVNTRGEYNSKENALEHAELQLLYSRLISYFFNAQAGIRQDFPIRPNDGSPARTHLVLGIEGLLPQLFEANLQLFVDHRGTVATRFEGAYDAFLTQRLVLQPRIELNAAANADRQSRLGSGLTTFETGLRLRYEFTREVAPYVGVQYQTTTGETRQLYKRAGEDPDSLSGIVGIRLFF